MKVSGGVVNPSIGATLEGLWVDCPSRLTAGRQMKRSTYSELSWTLEHILEYTPGVWNVERMLGRQPACCRLPWDHQESGELERHGVGTTSEKNGVA